MIEYKEWIAKKDEDRILEKYREYCLSQNIRGVIFWQVPVGKGYPQSEVRVIDAVRIPSKSAAVIKYFKESRGDFQKLIPGANADVIEIKTKLGRYVIGQAVVGKHLLEMEYAGTRATPIILCRVRDALLERVCRDKLGVKVWTPEDHFVT